MITMKPEDRHRVFVAAEIDKLNARIDELNNDATNHDHAAAVARRLAQKLSDDRHALRNSRPADGLKVGDYVRVRDERDGAIVERRTMITELNIEAAPGGAFRRWVATLSAGFCVATKCCEKVP
jgi:hypothetical protein